MQGLSRHGAWSLIAIVSGTLAPLNFCRGEFPPVRLFGDVGYELRYDWSEDSDTVLSNALSVRLNAATYIWQPWLAQVNGGLTLRFSDTQSDATESTSTVGGANARLRLFPVSRFPFEAFFDYRNNVVDDNLFDSSFEVLRYGVSQRYTPQGGGLSLGLRYEHSERESSRDERRDENSSNDFLELSAARNFGNLSTNWTSRFERSSQDNPERDEDRLFSILRHRYPVSPGATLNGQIIYRDDRIDLANSTQDNRRWEINEYFFWRPDTENPLLLTAAVRYLDVTVARNADDLRNRNLIGSLGASYQFNPHWGISANASSTLTEDSEGEQTTSAIESIVLNYDPDTIRFGQTNYNWFATLGATAEQNPDQEEETNVFTGQFGLGHSLSRNIIFDGGSTLQWRFSQSGDLGQDTTGKSFYGLDHNATLNWSYSEGGVNTLLSFIASDSRTYEDDGDDQGEQENESQLLSLQFSRSQSLSRYSSWSGIVLLQASRHVNRDNDELPDLELEDDDDLEPSVRIELNYRNQRLFAIRNLMFESTLRLYSDSYLPLLDDSTDPDDEEGQVWDNRLQYRIGRLDLLLTGRVSRINEELDGLIFFELRRNFDTIY